MATKTTHPAVEPHHQAAAHHTAAAHHHLQAAHLHAHGKVAEAKEHSTTAHTPQRNGRATYFDRAQALTNLISGATHLDI